MKNKTLFKITIGTEGNFYATNYDPNPKRPVTTAIGWFKYSGVHRLGEMLVNNEYEVNVVETGPETEIDELYNTLINEDKNCLNIRTHVAFDKTWNRKEVVLPKYDRWDNLLVAFMTNENGRIGYINRKKGRALGLTEYMNENVGYPLNKDLCEYRGELNVTK